MKFTRAVVAIVFSVLVAQIANLIITALGGPDMTSGIAAGAAIGIYEGFAEKN